MTTFATAFFVIALLCAITSVCINAKALRRLNEATRLVDLMCQQDSNYLNWKKSKERHL